MFGGDGDGVLVDAYPGRMARLGSLLLLDFTVFDPSTEDPAPEALEEMKRMLGAHGSIALCARIRAGSKPPPEATRRLMEAFVAAHSEALQPVVIILEGRGFWQATFRGLIATLVRSAKRGRAIEVTGSVDEAMDVLRARLVALPESKLRAFYDVPPRHR